MSNHSDVDIDFHQEKENKFDQLHNFESLNFNDHQEHSVDFAEDFKNLEKLDSDRLDGSGSLNLGSAYSQNEYQFDDKVSSVQRDLSLDNCTDEYNSIMNSSDISNSENNDRVAKLGEKSKKGLMRDKTLGKLSQPTLNNGMARIKSSAKLFTLENQIDDKSYESEWISELSTGDSAYPVISFKQRIVKEFEPKISIYNMNKSQLNKKTRMSRIPCHTKLTYEPPIRSKFVNSPPNQSSFEK